VSLQSRILCADLSLLDSRQSLGGSVSALWIISMTFCLWNALISPISAFMKLRLLPHCAGTHPQRALLPLSISDGSADVRAIRYRIYYHVRLPAVTDVVDFRGSAFKALLYRRIRPQRQ